MNSFNSHSSLSISPIELSPADLLSSFDLAEIQLIDKHQRVALEEISVNGLIAMPFPVVADGEESRLESLGNNISIYEDVNGHDLEDMIYDTNPGDIVLHSLIKLRDEYKNDERYARVIRVRRSVIAHYLLSLANSDQKF
ncbi:MAG: hypothetical protein U0451_02385 [Candidatus Saccharimonadales bacterium]